MKVTLFTDRPVVALGFRTALGAGVDEVFVAPFSETDPFVFVAQEIALVDVAPGSSLGLVERLRTAGARIIVLWTVVDLPVEQASQAVAMGVRGIIAQTASIFSLTECLRQVDRGQFWLPRELGTALVAQKRVALSKREGELVQLLSQGLKNKEIGSALSISEGTVKVYFSRLFQKIGVRDRFELALYGLKNLGAPVEEAPRPKFLFLANDPPA